MSDANITNVGSIALDSISGDGDTDSSITFSGSDVITIATGGSTAATFNASQVTTLSGNLIIPDAGNIGSASDTDAIAIGSDGDVTLTQDLELQHDGAILSFGANDEITLTHVHDTGLLLADSGGTPTLQFHDSNEAVLSDGSNLKLTSGGTTFTIPSSDGSSGQFLKTNGSGVLSFDTVSSAADDITAGDAAVTITTTAGNITVDAQGNDTDIIFKGTDGSADTTFLTIDGSAAGAATFNAGITATTGTFSGVVDADAGVTIDNITIDGTEIDLSSGDLTIDVAGDIILDADGADVIFHDAGTEYGRVTNSSTDFVIQTAVSDKDFVIKGNDGGATITPFTLDMSAGGDLFLTGGLIDLKNDGSAVSQIKFYCESSNAHAQTLIAVPHSESATNTLTLPSTGGNSYLVSAASTATLTNKTLTKPSIVDNGYIQFGTDNEVRLISNPDKGLIIKHTATADDKPSILTLQTGETDIAANDVLGKIEFQEPDEGTGTDAILVSAAIQAKSEGDFSASANATSLEFMTGASEAATAKVRITSAGHLVPTADDSYDLGTSSLQWRNIYTGDLHLSNMTKDIGNIVDGSKGDWTIQEGSEDLFIVNNNSGKKYKFNLTEV